MLTTEGATNCGAADQWRLAAMRRHVRPVAGDFLQDATALYGDTRTALGAAGIDYASAAYGFHANSEAVGFFAAGYGRLVGAFHDYSRLKNLYKEKFAATRMGLASGTRHCLVFSVARQDVMSYCPHAYGCCHPRFSPRPTSCPGVLFPRSAPASLWISCSIKSKISIRFFTTCCRPW